MYGGAFSFASRAAPLSSTPPSSVSANVSPPSMMERLGELQKSARLYSPALYHCGVRKLYSARIIIYVYSIDDWPSVPTASPLGLGSHALAVVGFGPGRPHRITSCTGSRAAHATRPLVHASSSIEAIVEFMFCSNLSKQNSALCGRTRAGSSAVLASCVPGSRAESPLPARAYAHPQARQRRGGF